MYWYEVIDNNKDEPLVMSTMFWKNAARAYHNRMNQYSADEYQLIFIHEYTWISKVFGRKRSIPLSVSGEIMKVAFRSIFWSKLKKQFV